MYIYIISSWYIDLFIIMKHLSLSPVIFLILKSIFIQLVWPLPLSYSYRLYHISFSILSISTYLCLKINCVLYTANSWILLFIQYDNLWHLVLYLAFILKEIFTKYRIPGWPFLFLQYFKKCHSIVLSASIFWQEVWYNSSLFICCIIFTLSAFVISFLSRF